MELFDIVILVIIICVIYRYLFYKNNESFNVEFQEAGQDDEYSINIKDANKYIDRILKAKTKGAINPNFLEMQFHGDYKDTLTAFNNIVPCQKQLFNRSNLPVTTIEPNINEIKQLIVSFINEVNKNIKNQDDNQISGVGWNDFKPENKIKSGWDKQQEALGLPTSIYKDGAERAPIKLIKIDHLEKYETDDETRHVTYLIIQKKNVSDQMVIRVSFVIDRNDLNMDREFFDSEKNFYETVVKIEEIFVVGFLSVTGKSKGSRHDFYNFESIKNEELIADKDIVLELNKKKKEYMNEIDGY